MRDDFYKDNATALFRCFANKQIQNCECCCHGLAENYGYWNAIVQEGTRLGKDYS